METQKFCVYNLTRESFLSLEASVVDTTAEPLRKIVEYLVFDAEKGLWFTPYKGIPPVPGIPLFDLVCLDGDSRVMDEVQSLSTADFEPLKAEAASALVLPVESIRLSQTRPGDQLLICPPEEMGQRLVRRSSQSAPAPMAQSAEPAAEMFADDSATPPPLSDSPVAEQHLANQMSDEQEEAESQDEGRDSFKLRFLRWLASDRRRASRHALPGLVAYCWDGEFPHAHHIGDISNSGLYLVTQERWFPGTKMVMTLQKANSNGASPGDSIAVQTRVVRWGADGDGLSFILSGSMDHESDEHRPENVANKKALKKFLQRVKQEESRELQLG